MDNSYDVFISYSSKEQKIAEGICGYLESRKYRCFVAYRDIPKGKIWAAVIPSAIHTSRMMLVVFSDSFNISNQTDRELELAAEDKIPILTFRISDTVFTGAKEYYLKNLNWIDAFPEPEKCFGQLYDSVSKLVPKPEEPIGDIEIIKEDTSEINNLFHNLKVKVDEDCLFYIDGEEKAKLTSENIGKFSLQRGEYELKFVSAENPVDSIEMEFEMPNFDKLLKICLREIRDKQLNTEVEKGIAEKKQREDEPKQPSVKKIREVVEHQKSKRRKAVDSNSFIDINRNDKIKLWESSRKIETITLKGHEDWVNMSSFSFDSRLLASASDDKTIKIWHVATGQVINTFFHRCPLCQVGFSGPDNKYVYGLESKAFYKKHFGLFKSLSSNKEKMLYLWDVKREKNIVTLDAIDSVSFSANGDSFVTNSYFPADLPEDKNGAIDFRNTLNGQITNRLFFDEFINWFKMSPDDSKILTYEYGSMSVYNKEGNLLFVIEIDADDASFNSDSNKILVTNSEGANVIDGSNGRMLYRLEKAEDGCAACFSHDNSFIVGMVDDEEEGQIIGFWDSNSGKLIRVLENIGLIGHISLSQDDSIIAASMYQ